MRRDLGQMLMFGTACSTHLTPVEEEEEKKEEEEEEGNRSSGAVTLCCCHQHR